MNYAGVTRRSPCENKHHPIDPADPVDAIKFRMEQQGLSLRMVKRLYNEVHIPYESLLARRGTKFGMDSQ